jgi:hypothetical protein
LSTTAVGSEITGSRPQSWSARARQALPLADELAGAQFRWAACALPVMGLLVLWAADNGGYDSVTWLASAIGLTALAIWSRLVFGAARPLGRFGRLAVLALASYVGWSFLSITWAVDKGAALIGSERALLYLLLFSLIAGLEWTRRRLELGMTLYLFGAGAVAFATLLGLALSPAPQLLQNGQLAGTLGYHNAIAALGTIGAAGAVLIGSADAQRPVIRAGLAAVAVACLEVSLLANSRGWLYTLPVIAAILYALAPHPSRVVLWALIPVCCALATLPWIAHGWMLADGVTFAHETVASAYVGAARAGLVAVVVSGSLGYWLARLQARYRLSRRGRRWARRVSRTVAALTVVGMAAGAMIAISDGVVTRGWHQFTTNAPLKAGVSRFSELGSGRYDFWRVAVKSFLAHPLGGLGQDNFAQAYVAGRRTAEEPTWVHSLELRLLVHTGVIGFVAFAALLVCALIAVRRAGRNGDSRLRLMLVAALVPLIVWIVHGSVDWFWEIPALSGAAVVFLAAAVALERESDVLRSRRANVLSRLAARHWLRAGGLPWLRLATPPWLRAGGRGAAGTALALAILAALTTTYLGERALGRARALAATRPAAALHELSLAAKLEPYSSTPLALGAGLELRAGHAADALQWARAGLRRDDGDWVLWLEDGLAAGAAHRAAAERAALAQAHSLDPGEPVIALAQKRAGTSDPLTIGQAASMFAGRVHRLVAP